MSIDPGFVLAVAISEVIPAAVFLYAAYWAFSIRRALTGRIYRNQALCMGSIGVLLALTGFITYSDNFYVNVGIGSFYAALFLTTFAFVDAIVPVARRSDPLLRPILNWGTTRIPLWIDTAFLAILAFVGTFFAGPSGQYGSVLFTIVGGILFAVSGAAIIIGARRSGDILLRASLRWVGITLLIFVLIFVVSSLVTSVFNASSYDQYYSYPAIPGGLVSIAGAYALYRAVWFLAPVGRLPVKETA